ncbi:MAG TPA: hypothetical protein VLH79_09360 [Chthonomonadales bacterium]|nr:hypothetical protein [Chthonomonadales bacterium]
MHESCDVEARTAGAIGVLEQAKARLCEQLLSVDYVDRVVPIARHCEGSSHLPVFAGLMRVLSPMAAAAGRAI